MVDIEPVLSYKISSLGIKNIKSIFIIIYLAFVYPLYLILNYDIKNQKEIIESHVLECIKLAECSFCKVSKRDIILEKDIMYFTNHTSVGDFFIDPYITHYVSKFISLNKIRLILPLLGIITYYTSSTIFISENNKKEKVIQNFKNIEETRKNDDIRNITLYPEGMRRPHRDKVSAVIKKGFIYHSFEHNLPIQIIHTTNKEYVIDDENILFNKKTNLFTYYGPKIDPQKIKTKFEKKYKRPFTKDDYYEYVYKQWSKIWKKMDKYRIDTLISQGLSYEDSVNKMKEYSTQFPQIENKVLKDDKPLPMSFLFIRSILWSILYFIIFKVIEHFFSILSKFYKKMSNPFGEETTYFSNTIISTSQPSNTCNMDNNKNTAMFAKYSFLFAKFPFLSKFPFSLALQGSPLS